MLIVGSPDPACFISLQELTVPLNCTLEQFKTASSGQTHSREQAEGDQGRNLHEHVAGLEVTAVFNTPFSPQKVPENGQQPRQWKAVGAPQGSFPGALCLPIESCEVSRAPWKEIAYNCTFPPLLCQDSRGGSLQKKFV